MTTVFDVAGEGSAKACWVLMRRAKRTSLSPQALPRNLRSFSRLPVTAPKNRTRIGPHLGRRKMTLFSPKTGYVRRSEFMTVILRWPSEARPSKDERPVSEPPAPLLHDRGASPTDLGFTRDRNLKCAGRL